MRFFFLLRACYPAGNDDTGDDGDEGEIGEPGLTLEGHDIREDDGEEGGGGADGLVERHRKVAEGDIVENDENAEDEAEGGDLEELEAGANGLHGDHLEPGDDNIAKKGAGDHVAHGGR